MQRRTGARHGQGGRGRRETSIGMPVAKTGWPLVAASIGHALIACTSLTPALFNEAPASSRTRLVL